MLALIRLNFVELFGMEVHGHLMTYMTPAHRAHTFQEAWRSRERQDLGDPLLDTRPSDIFFFFLPFGWQNEY